MLNVLLSKSNPEESPKRVEDSSLFEIPVDNSLGSSVFEIPTSNPSFSVGVSVEEPKSSSEVSDCKAKAELIALAKGLG